MILIIMWSKLKQKVISDERHTEKGKFTMWDVKSEKLKSLKWTNFQDEIFSFNSNYVRIEGQRKCLTDKRKGESHLTLGRKRCWLRKERMWLSWLWRKVRKMVLVFGCLDVKACLIFIFLSCKKSYPLINMMESSLFFPRFWIKNSQLTPFPPNYDHHHHHHDQHSRGLYVTHKRRKQKREGWT